MAGSSQKNNSDGIQSNSAVVIMHHPRPTCSINTYLFHHV